MPLADEYLARAGGDRILAGAALARELMEGDPMVFKQGYSLENAVLAAQDLFLLTAYEAAAVRQKVEQEDPIERWPIAPNHEGGD